MPKPQQRSRQHRPRKAETRKYHVKPVESSYSRLESRPVVRVAKMPPTVLRALICAILRILATPEIPLWGTTFDSIRDAIRDVDRAGLEADNWQIEAAIDELLKERQIRRIYDGQGVVWYWLPTVRLEGAVK